MPQDQASGAAASQWGRDTAKRLAAVLGASILAGNSNECDLNGERVVIKCAAMATDSVGVTFKMLDRVSRIVGAFEDAHGEFDVWSITPTQFRASMRDTASRGASAGKVGLVRKALFEQCGSSLGHVRI